MKLDAHELSRVYKRLLDKAGDDGFIVEGGLHSTVSLIAFGEKIPEYKARRYRQMLELQGYLQNKGGGTMRARWYVVSSDALPSEPRLVPVPKLGHGGKRKKVPET